MATDIDTILTHRQRAANASRTRADYRGTYPYIRIPVDEWEALRDEIERLRVALEVFTDYTSAGIVVAPVAETATAIAELIGEAAQRRRDTGLARDNTLSYAISEGAVIAREYAAKEG